MSSTDARVIVAMINVLEFPPRESCNNLVNLESRKFTNSCPSLSCFITRLNADNDLWGNSRVIHGDLVLKMFPIFELNAHKEIKFLGN